MRNITYSMLFSPVRGISQVTSSGGSGVSGSEVVSSTGGSTVVVLSEVVSVCFGGCVVSGSDDSSFEDSSSDDSSSDNSSFYESSYYYSS